MRTLVFVVLLLGCAGATPAPRAVPASRPASVASAPPPRFVALRSNLVVCGLTDRGELQCWGYELPLREKRSATPVPVPGLEPIGRVADFSVVPHDNVLVAWNAEGRAMFLEPSADRPIELPVTNTENHRDSRPRRIAEGSGNCLRTVEGEVLCYSYGRFRSGGPRITALAAAGSCGVDERGAVLHFRLEGSYPWRWVVEPMALPRAPRAFYCGYTRDGIEGCAVGGEGEDADALHCTSPELTERIAALAEDQPVASFHRFSRATCVVRADGSARCAARSPADAQLLAGLDELDARGGLVSAGQGVCALDGDGVVHCVGARESLPLGRLNRDSRNGEIRRLEGFDGAIRISSDGGVTCAQTAEREVRCFGGWPGRRISTEPFALPEPIDEMVGGFVLCVRGVSGAWWCRDIAGVSFRGRSSDGWFPLRDQRGRPLRESVTSMGVEAGDGVSAALASGRVLRFYAASRRVPFRLRPFPAFGESVARISGVEGAIHEDGSATMFPEANPPIALEGPIRAIYGSCYVDDAQRATCVDLDTRAWTASLDDVVQLHHAALTSDGAVHVRDGLNWLRRDGLPPMRAVAGSCGISRADEIWCWGSVAHTSLPAISSTPTLIRAR